VVKHVRWTRYRRGDRVRVTAPVGGLLHRKGEVVSVRPLFLWPYDVAVEGVSAPVAFAEHELEAA
jgi:hypothetical protein